MKIGGIGKINYVYIPQQLDPIRRIKHKEVVVRSKCESCANRTLKVGGDPTNHPCYFCDNSSNYKQRTVI